MLVSKVVKKDLTMARPREFDMDQALEQAMHAFWDHGYEATSLADLMQAMDLQKGSIYKAFGDKHSLFIAALDRYLDDLHTFNQETIESGSTPKEGLRLWLNTEIKLVCGQTLQRGCLLVNSLVERAYQDDEVAQRAKAHLMRTHKLLTKTITAGQALNEFRKDLSASELAQLISVSFIGMLAMTKGPLTKSACLQIAKNIFKVIE